MNNILEPMLDEKRARLEEIRTKISAACKSSGRNVSDVTLIAVSKTKPVSDIEEFAKLGVKVFGENYVQEALEKQKVIAAAGIAQLQWHLIGTLQSKKAKVVPNHFSLFHALDSLSLAQKIDKAAAGVNIVQRCLLEVNIDQETSKGGLAENALAHLLEELSLLKNLSVEGLMCIPNPHSGNDSRIPFQALRLLQERLNATSAYREELTDLSMGMSSDFEAAILEGATYVRVGTALFGERNR